MSKKINIFDTHFHLFEKRYKQETDFSEQDLISKAKKNNITWFCNVGTSVNDSIIVVKQIQKYENVFGIVGHHPNNAKKWNKKLYIKLEKLLTEKKIVAIGEIGLDYFKKFSTKKEQQKCFVDQLILSKKYNLPVSLHLRDSYDDTLQIINDLKINKGIVHCFSGTIKDAKKFINLGFLISISGIVTFKNAKKLQEIVRQIPIEKIVVETDAPYLTPAPFRGKINYSEYIKYTIQKIADLKKLSFEDVSNITSKNALNFFNINNKLD